MANTLSPTAANIISSLGIKGATVNEALPGYVPILGPGGKLSADFIPANAAQAALPHLSDAAFVDPHTEVDSSLRNGSIVAPYKTISEAADNFRPSGYAQNADYVAFLLSPGIYDGTGNQTMAFPSGWAPDSVYVISLGVSRFPSGLLVQGMGSAAEQTVVLQGIDVPDSASVTVLGNPKVICAGRTYIGGGLSSGSGSPIRKLVLSADSHVGSPIADEITFLSQASGVKNTSSVPGATVENALDRLSGRRIRMARISGSGSGLLAGSSYDVTAESSSGHDVYRLGENDRAIVGAVRELYGRLSDINANSVTAENVTVGGTLTVRTLGVDSLMMGGRVIEIDAYGYLVVSEGREYHGVPEGAYVLRDVDDGSLWLVGVHEGGRLFIERFYDDLDSSDSSSGSVVTYDEMDFTDSGERYLVTIRNGRMVIEKDNG